MSGEAKIEVDEETQELATKLVAVVSTSYVHKDCALDEAIAKALEVEDDDSLEDDLVLLGRILAARKPCPGCKQRSSTVLSCHGCPSSGCIKCMGAWECLSCRSLLCTKHEHWDSSFPTCTLCWQSRDIWTSGERARPMDAEDRFAAVFRQESEDIAAVRRERQEKIRIMKVYSGEGYDDTI